jgi:hypothetical protein
MEWSELINCWGGIGGMIAGISAWLANIWSNRILQQEKASQDKQLEILKTSLESIKEHNIKYTTAQFDSYNSLWCALVDLQNSAERLWEIARHDELLVFIKSLNKASELIQKSRIFLEEGHYQQFLEITCNFRSFSIGKQELLKIRSRRELEYITNDQIEREVRQIDTNGVFRSEYRTLLNQIAESLKTQLGLRNSNISARI